MDPISDQRLDWHKERYPKIDLDLVRFFARTMVRLHDMASMMDVYFARQDLSKGRFMVMIQLHGDDTAEGVNISDLISQYHVSSATMTGIIDTLEKEDLIERIRCPQDRRKVNIRITEAGQAFMDDFLPKHHAYMKLFSEKLSEKERITLLNLMNKLHTGISEGFDQDIDFTWEDEK